MSVRGDILSKIGKFSVLENRSFLISKRLRSVYIMLFSYFWFITIGVSTVLKFLMGTVFECCKIISNWLLIRLECKI